jgi:hypothetical protein
MRSNPTATVVSGAREIDVCAHSDSLDADSLLLDNLVRQGARERDDRTLGRRVVEQLRVRLVAALRVRRPYAHSTTFIVCNTYLGVADEGVLQRQLATHVRPQCPVLECVVESVFLLGDTSIRAPRLATTIVAPMLLVPPRPL